MSGERRATDGEEANRSSLRVLFIGDIVGPPGLAIIRKVLPGLRASEEIDLVVANAENATNGSGLLPRDFKHLRAAGVDAVTLGDHIYKKFDLAEVLASPGEPICKPANYPIAAPGRDHILVTIGGLAIAVISLMGRTFMKPVDCPFAAIDRVLAALPNDTRIILVDVHAEATADKYLLARYLDGKVTAVIGTHTHVPTADEQILPGGTAFLCDVGMTGPYDSILGRRIDRVLHTVTTFEPTAFDVATGDARLAGAIVEADASTGKAITIRRVMLRDEENARG